jgi:hypothetical protein
MDDNRNLWIIVGTLAVIVVALICIAVVYFGYIQPLSPEPTIDINTIVAQTMSALQTAATPTPPGGLGPGEFTPTVTMIPLTKEPTVPATSTEIMPSITPRPSVTPTLSPDDPRNVLGDPTWRDSFDSTTNWTLFDDTCFKSDIYDSKFWMNSKVAPSATCWEVTWPKIQDFYLETTSNTVGECGGGDRYGLFFRGPDTTQGYLFGLTCDGRYGMARWDPDDTKWDFFVDFKTSEYINEGPDQTNRFGVMANGSQFGLYINGNLVETVEEETYLEPGLIGYFIGASETEGFQVSYDELVYWNEP